MLRSVRDHNSTRYGRDLIFFLGSDKHAFLEKALAIGGADSMYSHMLAGVRVVQHEASEMPAHVQADADYLPLACIECAPSACPYVIHMYVVLHLLCGVHRHDMRMRIHVCTCIKATENTPPLENRYRTHGARS